MKNLADSFRAPGKRLVAYLNVGDPGVSRTPVDYVQLACACVDAGADVLELGVPFSDPFADGPAIAAASHRALGAGGGFRETLRVAAAIRARSPVPLVLFGYANPLIVRGFERAANEAADAGIDALLVVDLPVSGHADDAAHQLRAAAWRAGVGVVPLLAPTSDPSRIAAVAEAAASTPFVYYVSVAGVTGAKSVPLDAASARAADLEAKLHVPVAIGFGIDGPEKAKLAAFGSTAAGGATGVVVGTALVVALASEPTMDGKIAAAQRILQPLRAAITRMSL